jgi:hydrophobe/amphiphile efflux-1 (HAE1) family protein
MLMAALIVFGIITFHRLGISQLPDVDFPVISVSLTLNGAAPEIIESQVLDPLEDSIMQIDGIKDVVSTAQQSSGSMSIEFNLDQNIDIALEQVQNHINQVKNLLPPTLFPPMLRKINPEDQPILWLAVTTDDPNTKPIDMMIFARNYLYDVIGIVPGVGNIYLGGYTVPALRIWADIKKLTFYNFTTNDVLNAIIAEHYEAPAGTISDKDKEYYLRVMGEAKDAAAFGSIRINNRANQGPNFQPTRLDQIGTVEEGVADIRKISYVNNQYAVGLGIVKQHGSNAVEVADNIRKKLEEIKPLLPPHLQVSVRTDLTVFIRQSVRELVFMLGLSALLTSLVCYLFLGSWVSTLNVLMAIPTSVIGAFIGIYFWGFTLNTFTLLGLSLAIGIIVDDAIMMLENIVRHQETLGEDMYTAAINGANEITFAALAATLAIAAIFLPVVFMQGIIGRYFMQYGITVTIAVFLSLLEALTLTPMRCSRYLHVAHSSKGIAAFVDRTFHKLAKAYERSLVLLLEHRWKVIVVTFAIFVSSLGLARLIQTEMMPAQDQSMFLLRFKLPVGTSLPVTDDTLKTVQTYLLKQPSVGSLYCAVGGFGADAVNTANVFVMLVDPDKRKLNQQQVMRETRKDLLKMFPKMETVLQDLSLRGFAATRGFPVEFIVQGPDWDTLTDVTGKIMDQMKASHLMADVNTDVQSGMPEVEITPDRYELAHHGTSVATVTNIVNAMFGGAVLTGQTEYTKDRHRYEIELRLIAGERDKVPDLKSVKIRNNIGEIVPLDQVVQRVVKPSLLLIQRYNRSRSITVYANPAPGHSQDEAIKKAQAIAKSLLPPGYTYMNYGSSQAFRESFVSLIVAMFLGILVSYMVLASQFNSFIHPFTVLMALPFSISGAFLGLLVFKQTLNIYSLIGIILLMGIVKKNSILLVDFTNHVRENEGLDVKNALVKACPIRLRPILMTSIATVAGAAPEAFAIGPGAETTIPMAVAIIGGVMASTFLTLFVVPCVYSLASALEHPDPLLVEKKAKARQEALERQQKLEQGQGTEPMEPHPV